MVQYVLRKQGACFERDYVVEGPCGVRDFGAGVPFGRVYGGFSAENDWRPVILGGGSARRKLPAATLVRANTWARVGLLRKHRVHEMRNAGFVHKAGWPLPSAPRLVKVSGPRSGWGPSPTNPDRPSSFTAAGSGRYHALARNRGRD
jgi:hypothetical protein